MQNFELWFALAMALWGVAERIHKYYIAVRAGKAEQAVDELAKVSASMVVAGEKVATLYPDNPAVAEFKKSVTAINTSLGTHASTIRPLVGEFAGKIGNVVADTVRFANPAEVDIRLATLVANRAALKSRQPAR